MKIVTLTRRNGKVVHLIAENISAMREETDGTTIVMNSGDRYSVTASLSNVKNRIAHQNAAEDVE